MYITISSSKLSNGVSSIPQLTGHSHRWHTLMALPGQNTLARRDLGGFRPSFEVTRPRPDPYAADEDPAFSRRIARAPLLPLSNSAVSGHVTSVSQTMQTRMAVAGQAAAARARVTSHNRP